RGVRTNREGIGARLVLETGGRSLVRHVSRGGSYLSASDATARFGIGTNANAARLTIEWPSGATQTIGPLLPGELYEVQEGGSSPSQVRTIKRRPSP
ncbi:MAG TPA: ASPIC/UnbV domain-containing protein, partial [Planctomycetota bacterium]|nr:ASPIC/UnbV domain-containing protein [Planctomycetota bacterium]